MQNFIAKFAKFLQIFCKIVEHFLQICKIFCKIFANFLQNFCNCTKLSYIFSFAKIFAKEDPRGFAKIVLRTNFAKLAGKLVAGGIFGRRFRRKKRNPVGKIHFTFLLLEARNDLKNEMKIFCQIF